MPQVSVQTTSGRVSFHYTISTPEHPSAQAIDSALPTILFLHPIYIGHFIYHPQFSDPRLRRFNLVAFDSRCHGKTVGAVSSNFRSAEAAEDVHLFMEALSLPPCHIIGMSMGACVALQFSVNHPHKVLSLSMISPLPLEEPVDVADGRQEIYDCWVESYKDGNSRDHDALLDSICGALQLGFNGERTKLIQATTQLAVSDAMRNWTPKKFSQFHTVSVKFFCDRKPHSNAVLKRIRCPISLIHCGSDIAYPVECAEELRDCLRDSGVNVRLTSVEDAPHFGSVTHPTEINAILHDFLVEQVKGNLPPPPTGGVVSPFHASFSGAGCSNLGDGDSDDSDDDEFSPLH